MIPFGEILSCQVWDPLCSKVPCFLSHVSRRGYMMINRKLYLCFIFKLPFDSFEQHKALPLGPNNNWQS